MDAICTNIPDKLRFVDESLPPPLLTNNNETDNVLMNIVEVSNGRHGRGRGHILTGRDGRGKNSHFCTYYVRINHTVDTCYHKHSFSPGYKFKQGATKYANMVAFVNAQEDNTPFEVNPTNYNIQISQEQYNNLLALIQQSSSQNSCFESYQYISNQFSQIRKVF